MLIQPEHKSYADAKQKCKCQRDVTDQSDWIGVATKILALTTLMLRVNKSRPLWKPRSALLQSRYGNPDARKCNPDARK
jgi:hypothetical protein